jgi:hypothetical protein
MVSTVGKSKEDEMRGMRESASSPELRTTFAPASGDRTATVNGA